MTGLRERKKRQTRQLISDIATGLFLDRGFDRVTIAEIAEAAEVSVNTVYNYFPSKEDLFFDREPELIARSSALVRERQPGQSAADALLAQLRKDLDERTVHVGMTEGYARFMECVRESPALLARMWVMQARVVQGLTETLREEAGATPDDPAPEVVATQLVGVNNTIFRTVSMGVAEGVGTDEISRRARRKLEAFVALLSDEVLNYATRPAG
ncbi:TetR/AcrR family transcriptional regulator [Streptomyces sp. N2-109]|uniref:TetR/AcrR family transcriptional regulator n=1 Tax=Streptomyces gossypii TaxID=2883101 RepID=A0ABT2JYL3_9ACTN|nr:TetR/AcrR family transcriptional regulator [Streptomyces gossypii]MCT2592435.1 TetR/AcrR family transcriptional regulator [Streptomyces gossypii]